MPDRKAALRGSKTTLKPAFGQIDDDRIVNAFRPIVFRQFLPQPSDLHPDSRFLAGIVGGRLAQSIHGDGVFLQIVGRSASEASTR